MQNLDQPTALEWLWRGLSLLAIPALGWGLKLSGDLARAEYQREDALRRIGQLEADARVDAKTLGEIKGLIIELKTQSGAMMKDIAELKAKIP